MAPRRWLVSGTSSGIGRELVALLAQRGDVALATVRTDTDAETVAALGSSVTPIRLDLTDPIAIIEDRVREAIDAVGGLDVLVNNAGYGLVGAVEETSEDEARHQLETNFWGVWKLVHAALPALRASSDARIMNITSTSGIVGYPAMAFYAASKFAVEGFSHALRAELAPLGVAVTIIEPGGFRTKWAGPGLRTTATELPEYSGTIATKMRARVPSMHGSQPGDPVRAAQTLVELVESADPPLRLPLGTDAIATVRGHLQATSAELDRWLTLSQSTDFPVDEDQVLPR
jgi:NAD(P)-dependent dehydrogenase (short-subunit alcohol dehydrogenase family)